MGGICVHRLHMKSQLTGVYSDFQASCNAKAKSIEHLVFMHLVSVITVVFIHTMEEDQRLNTLGDTLHFSKNHYPSSCLQRTVDNVQSY